MTRYCVILEGSINFKEENTFLAVKQNILNGIWELTRGFRKKTIKSPMRKVDQIEDSSTSIKTGACRPAKTEKPLITNLKRKCSIED